MNLLSRFIYISVIGHLLFFTGVGLVISPLKMPPVEFAAINFLGPIPANMALFSQGEQASSQWSKHVARKAHFEAITNFNLSQYLYAWEDRFQNKELFPSASAVAGEKVFFLDKLKTTSPAAIRGDNFLQIDGPAGRRSVVFRPKLPVLPAAFPNERPPLVVELKFLVTPDGRAYNIEQVKTSGYADVDLLGIKFIKALRFTPISTNSQAADWGKVILNF